MTITRTRAAAVELAKFCAALRWDELPPEARERTKELVLDHVGVALRGSLSESSRAVQSFVATQPAGAAKKGHLSMFRRCYFMPPVGGSGLSVPARKSTCRFSAPGH